MDQNHISCVFEDSQKVTSAQKIHICLRDIYRLMFYQFAGAQNGKQKKSVVFALLSSNVIISLLDAQQTLGSLYCSSSPESSADKVQSIT
jgi:hypothetical protein